MARMGQKKDVVCDQERTKLKECDRMIKKRGRGRFERRSRKTQRRKKKGGGGRSDARACRGGNGGEQEKRRKNSVRSQDETLRTMFWRQAEHRTDATRTRRTRCRQRMHIMRACVRKGESHIVPVRERGSE